MKKEYQLSIFFPSHVLDISMKLSVNDIDVMEKILLKGLILKHIDKTSGKTYIINTINVLWFEFTALKLIE